MADEPKSHAIQVAVHLAPLFLVVLSLSCAADLSPLTGSAPVQARTAALQGTTYYVAPDGDDSNPGTEAEPWQTIQKAADTLLAGDTVYIRAGTYSERVAPLNSGSAGQLSPMPLTRARRPSSTERVWSCQNTRAVQPCGAGLHPRVWLAGDPLGVLRHRRRRFQPHHYRV